MHASSLSHVWLFATLCAVARQALLPWNFPGMNTGVGCHFLLQEIFQNQGLNLHLLHQQADSLLLSHQRNPEAVLVSAKIWKQTRCPSVGEGIKLRNSQTIQKYSALERDELPSNEDTYRNLKIHIIKYKKLNWKGYVLSDSNYVTFWKRFKVKPWR